MKGKIVLSKGSLLKGNNHHLEHRNDLIGPVVKAPIPLQGPSSVLCGNISL